MILGCKSWNISSPQLIIALILCTIIAISPSDSKSKVNDKKWTTLPPEVRPSAALLTAQQIWNSSVGIEEMLKLNFGEEEYEKRRKVEEMADGVLKDLSEIEETLKELIETVEAVGGFKSFDVKLKYLISSKKYDKITENPHQFADEINGVIKLNKEDGSKLLQELNDFDTLVKEMATIFFILGQVGIPLKQETESETKSEPFLDFDVQVLRNLTQLFTLIDIIEDKVTNALKHEEDFLDENGDKITDEEIIIGWGTRQRYDIYNNQIKPLVQLHSEMLLNFDSLIRSRLSNLKTLSSGKLFNSFEELTGRLEKLVDDIAETDKRILEWDLKFKAFDHIPTQKDIQGIDNSSEIHYEL